MRKRRNKNSGLIKIIILLAIAIGAASVYLLVKNPMPSKPIAGQVTTHEWNQAANIGGSFELIDQNNEPFNSDQLHGKISIIYFGFSYCPDICPTSLQKLVKVVETLDKYQIGINPVFITVDPMRDTPALLKEYLAHFHTKFIGLTAINEAQIKLVADKFKVYYAKADPEDKNDAKYMIDHSSFIYILDKNGKYMKHFSIESSPEEIIEFIRVNK